MLLCRHSGQERQEESLDVLRRTEAERGTVILFADRYQRGDFNLLRT